MSIRWLVSALVLEIQTRKEQLPDFTFRSTEPKFIFVKPALKYAISDLDKDHMNMRHVFNRTLEKTIQKYDRAYAIKHR